MSVSVSVNLLSISVCAHARAHARAHTHRVLVAWQIVGTRSLKRLTSSHFSNKFSTFLKPLLPFQLCQVKPVFFSIVPHYLFLRLPFVFSLLFPISVPFFPSPFLFVTPPFFLFKDSIAIPGDHNILNIKSILLETLC